MAVLEPEAETVHFLGFLIFVVADCALAAAFWTPSVPLESLTEPGVDTSWDASDHEAARVPVHAARLLLPLLLAVAAGAVWRADDWPSPWEDERFAPGLCLVAAQTLLVWRACARIGYRSPTEAMAMRAVAREAATRAAAAHSRPALSSSSSGAAGGWAGGAGGQKARGGRWSGSESRRLFDDEEGAEGTAAAPRGSRAAAGAPAAGEAASGPGRADVAAGGRPSQGSSSSSSDSSSDSSSEEAEEDGASGGDDVSEEEDEDDEDGDTIAEARAVRQPLRRAAADTAAPAPDGRRRSSASSSARSSSSTARAAGQAPRAPAAPSSSSSSNRRRVSFSATTMSADGFSSPPPHIGAVGWRATPPGRSRRPSSAASSRSGVAPAVTASAASLVRRLAEARARGAMAGGELSAVERDGQVGGSTVFQLYSAAEAREDRSRQWCAAASAVLLCAAQLVAAAVLFWGFGTERDDLEAGDPARAAVVYVYAIASWVAQTAVAATVPLVSAPRGALDDPFVRPRPASGVRPLQVLMLLPADGFDAAAAATTWFLLTARGHEVTVATPGGRQPLPDPVSIEGFGAGVWGAGPLTAAMFERMSRSGALERPLNAAAATPEAFDGMVLPGGTVRAAALWAADAGVRRVVAGAWSRGLPTAACGTGSVVLAATAQHSHSRLSLAESEHALSPLAGGSPEPDRRPAGAAAARSAAVSARRLALLRECSVTALPWQAQAAMACLACATCADEPEDAASDAERSLSRRSAAKGRASAGCLARAGTPCAGRRPRCRCGCRRADCSGLQASEVPGFEGRRRHGCSVCASWWRRWACGCDCCRGCAPCEDGATACRLCVRNACALCCCCCPDAAGGVCGRGRLGPGSERARQAAARSARQLRDDSCLECLRCAACGWAPVQAAVSAAVGGGGRFLRGKLIGLGGERGTPWDDSAAFVVEDGLLLTGRWGGDAFLLGRRYLVLLESTATAADATAMR